MAKFIVFVGTVMGTAQGVAEALSRKLREENHTCVVETAPRAVDLTLDPDAIWIFCTSNTGAGDLPANIQPFYEELTSQYPAIGGRRYGMIILGDSCYPTFAEAGYRLDAALADIGAQKVGDSLILDAMTGDDPQELALSWLEAWITAL